MARLNQILVLSAISLITLAGCDSAEEAFTPKTSSSAVPAATAKTDKPATLLYYPELSGIAFNTKKAVEAGDFAKAKTEFVKFENSWKKFKDPIKAKAPKGHDALEETTAKVTTELKKSQPSKDKLIADLESIDKTIKTFPKP